MHLCTVLSAGCLIGLTVNGSEQEWTGRPPDTMGLHDSRSPHTNTPGDRQKERQVVREAGSKRDRYQKRHEVRETRQRV